MMQGYDRHRINTLLRQLMISLSLLIQNISKTTSESKFHINQKENKHLKKTGHATLTLSKISLKIKRN